MATKPTRADTLTGTKRQIDYFSDFVNSFTPSPFSDELGRVINENAVNQSLRNLIKTNLGERFFQPNIGSDVLATLFEQRTPESIDDLELFIRSCIKTGEPRAEVNKVLINEPDFNDNAIEITIVYNLINNPEEITLNVILKRVR